MIIYYPVAPPVDPSSYTAAQLTAMLTALKCDYAASALLLPQHLVFTDAVAEAASSVLPSRLAAAALAASAAGAAACSPAALAANADGGPVPARRALQAAAAVAPLSGPVTATAALALLSLLATLDATDPLVANTPLGVPVLPVAAALLSAANSTAYFPLSAAVWSAASGATSGWGTTSFLDGGNTTVQQAPGSSTLLGTGGGGGGSSGGLAPATQLAIGLGVGLGGGLLLLCLGLAAYFYCRRRRAHPVAGDALSAAAATARQPGAQLASSKMETTAPARAHTSYLDGLVRRSTGSAVVSKAPPPGIEPAAHDA